MLDIIPTNPFTRDAGNDLALLVAGFALARDRGRDDDADDNDEPDILDQCGRGWPFVD